MKRIYDFSRKPAVRNYTIADLQMLKGSGCKLSIANPSNKDEVQACVEAGIDLFSVGTDQIEDVRSIAPTHFTSVANTWAQLGSNDERSDSAELRRFCAQAKLKTAIGVCVVVL